MPASFLASRQENETLAVFRSRTHHVEQVEIIVSDIAGGVIALFERFGFRICGLMPRGIRIDSEDVDTWITVLLR